MAGRISASDPPARRVARRRLLAAAGAGIAALAAPRVSRAQTAVWRLQTAWPMQDICHEFALDYTSRVEQMTGRRLRFEVLPAGAVVPAFQMQDAVHAGILDGGHGVCDAWSHKHKAFSLFGCPPSFGWDAHSMLGWFYHGGGEALYRELINDRFRLNVTGWLYFPMPAQPLGWFRKPVGTAGDLKGLNCRIDGLAADLFRRLGAAVVLLPGGEVAPAMEHGVLDAAGFGNPSSDLQRDLPEVARFYLMGSHHRAVGAFEVIFNKAKHDALPAELRAILRQAALAASTDQLGAAYVRYAGDLEEIARRGVHVMRASPALLEAELAAWSQVIAEYSRDAFFAKVIASQKAWIKRLHPYLQLNNLGSAELAAAYRHFFG